jgi:hypothetical protein
MIEILGNLFHWPGTKDDDVVIFVGDDIKVTKKEIEQCTWKDIWDKLKHV